LCQIDSIGYYHFDIFLDSALATQAPKDYLPLHPLELRILMALLRGPSFGSEIVRAIEAKERGGLRLYPANLYRRIRDLLGHALLEASPTPQGADPRRSYVAITPLGRAVAEAETRRLQALVRDAIGEGLAATD
jgi:DNA-binding PadR family transcriptional regulator